MNIGSVELMPQDVGLPYPVLARRAKPQADANTRLASFDSSALKKRFLIFNKN
jgi:hypothetical protein